MFIYLQSTKAIEITNILHILRSSWNSPALNKWQLVIKIINFLPSKIYRIRIFYIYNYFPEINTVKEY